MKKLNKAFLLIGLALTLVSRLPAQSLSKADSPTRLSLEIDPATFFFSGYGFHLRVQPKNSQRLLLGAGAYAMNLPKVLVNLNPENKNEGWNVRINQGYGLFAEYHFAEVNRKWFVGSQMGVQQFKIGKENLAESSKYTNILAMGYLCYTLRPFQNGLYFKPWFGAGYTRKVSGTSNLAKSEYAIAPLTAFATLHLGYTF